MNQPTTSKSPDPTSLQKFSVRTPSQLNERCSALRSNDFVIQGLMPRQSLTISIGDSGLGKTPLQYQKAICVAAGVPFLGIPVQQGRVLYMDSENGIAEVDNMVAQISKFLGLSQPPENLYLWNMNDCAEEFGERGHTIRDMISEIRPLLVIVDPYNAIFRTLEKDNGSASDEFQSIRSMMKEYRCAFDGLHHIRKRDLKNENYSQSFESANLREWFQQTRGPRLLINGSDIRIGLDEPDLRENCLLVRGFRRVDGEFPPIHLKRVLDDEGEPMGYERMSGIDMVSYQDHRELYQRLPDEFTFKLAKTLYGKADEATNGALRAFIAAGIGIKVRPGLYRKTSAGAMRGGGGVVPGVAGVDSLVATNILIQ